MSEIVKESDNTVDNSEPTVAPVKEEKPAQKKPEKKPDSSANKSAEKKTDTAEKKPEIKAAAQPAFTQGDIIDVKDLAIYKVPVFDGPAKLYSGNIQIIDVSDSFIQIGYVKPGFGMVTGFVSKGAIEHE